jgi:hypothetical protein
MRTRVSCPLVVLALVAVLAGCGGEPEHPPQGDGHAPIMVIRQYPGLGPAAARYALPAFVLLGDGTAVVATARQGNTLTAERRVLTPAQVADLYRRAGHAGLMRSREYRQDDILDASAMVVRITTDRGVHETTVIQPSTDDRGARGRVVKFAAAASAAGAAGGAYLADRVALIVIGDLADTPRCQVVDRARAVAKDGLLVRPLLPYEHSCADL